MLRSWWSRRRGRGATGAGVGGPALGAGPATGGGADDAFDRLLSLLFPGGLDDGQRSRIVAAVGDGDPFAPAVVRRMLGVLDQQIAPSPVSVRFGPDDLDRIEVAVAVDEGAGGEERATLLLDRADASVSVQVRDDGWYEPHIATALDRLLTPGDVFVDVGANVGYHAVRAALRVGGAGRVIAVEANSENARLLALTVAQNGFDHVEVWPLALGERLGHAHFGVHIGSNGGFAPDDVAAVASGRGTVVPVVPLDMLGLARVDVIKIDVEGAEPMVLAGAMATIDRCRPAVVMELSCEMTRRVGGTEPEEHLRRLTERGYRLHVLDRSGGPPIAYESPAALLATWDDPVRLDDLLFLPPDRNWSRDQ